MSKLESLKKKTTKKDVKKGLAKKSESPEKSTKRVKSSATKKAKTVKPVVKKSAKKTSTKKKETIKTKDTAASNNSGFKKVFSKNKNMFTVTFRLTKEAAQQAKTVNIVGDFNAWNNKKNSMRKLKNGDFVATIDLKPGKEYQFRYLIDNTKWENDWKADKYVKNPFGHDNSVIVL